MILCSPVIHSRNYVQWKTKQLILQKLMLLGKVMQLSWPSFNPFNKNLNIYLMSSDSYHNLARKYGSHTLQRHSHYLQRQTIIVLHDNIICFVVSVAVEVPTGAQVSSDEAVFITSLRYDFLRFYYPLPSQICTRRGRCCTKMGCRKHCISYRPTLLPLLVRTLLVCFCF